MENICQTFCKEPLSFNENEISYANNDAIAAVQQFRNLRLNKKWPDFYFTNTRLLENRKSLSKYFGDKWWTIDTNRAIIERLVRQEILKFLNINYPDFIKSILSEDSYINFVEKTVGDNRYDCGTVEAKLVLFAYYCILVNSNKAIEATSKLFDGNFKDKIFAKYDAELKKQHSTLLNNIEKVVKTKLTNLSIRALIPRINYINSGRDIEPEFKNMIESRYKFELGDTEFDKKPGTSFHYFKKYFFRLFDENDPLYAELKKRNFPFSNNTYNPLNFLQSIWKHNPKTVSYKLLDYIFQEKLSEEKNYEIVVNNNLDIEFCFEEYFKILNLFHSNWILNKYLNVDMGYTFYPWYNIDQSKIDIGQKLFIEFINKLFGKNSKDVINLLLNFDKQISYFETNGQEYKGTIRDLISLYDVKYDEVVKFLKIASKEWFYDRNIMNRFYLVFTFVNENADNYDETIRCVMSYLIDSICKITGFECKLCNSVQRSKNYLILKKNLKKFDVELDDCLKNHYQICLLDRSTATITEKLKFPEFEMLGDKIWNESIAEMLFDDVESKNSSDINLGAFKGKISDGKHPGGLFRSYIKATTQEVVAKQIELDKLYITATKDMGKYNKLNLYDDYVSHKEQNYLADSLEMILGVYAKQTSIADSIKLCKRLITHTFGKSLYYRELSKEAICEYVDIDYYECDYMNSLIDLLTIDAIGIDTKEKRKRLSFKSYMGNSDLQEEIWHFYRENGYELTISKYKNELIKLI